jgi:hypothetical protein
MPDITPSTGRPVAYDVRYEDRDLATRAKLDDIVYRICLSCAGADDKTVGSVRVRQGEFKGKKAEPVFRSAVDWDEFNYEYCEDCGKPLVLPKNR